MSNLVAKLKSLKLELGEDLFVHLTFSSLSKRKLNFNFERKLKLSNLIMVMNTMVDMMDQENNI
ncbi:hypothetical protein CR513_47147, partial [Mucuna pruriens]